MTESEAKRVLQLAADTGHFDGCTSEDATRCARELLCDQFPDIAQYSARVGTSGSHLGIFFARAHGDGSVSAFRVYAKRYIGITVYIQATIQTP